MLCGVRNNRIAGIMGGAAVVGWCIASAQSKGERLGDSSWATTYAGLGPPRPQRPQTPIYCDRDERALLCTTQPTGPELSPKLIDPRRSSMFTCP